MEEIKNEVPEVKIPESEKKPVEIVQIPKDKLDAVLSRLERLESAASKAGLSKYDATRKHIKEKIISLKTLDGKVIINWDNMVKNIVEKNDRGYWSEEQTVKLNFEDGTSDTMPYVVFSRRYEHLSCVLEKQIKYEEGSEEFDKYGEYLFTLKSVDGKKYEVGSKFVN